VAYQSILDEIEHLNGVGTRLEGLADKFPTATMELLIIAANVIGMATMLGVLIATRLDGNNGSLAPN
jgi:hypothetical protein